VTVELTGLAAIIALLVCAGVATIVVGVMTYIILHGLSGQMNVEIFLVTAAAAVLNVYTLSFLVAAGLVWVGTALGATS